MNSETAGQENLIPIAVRTLCEFAARSGSLDHRYNPAPSAEEGRAGHLLVSRRRGEGYLRELSLSGQCRGLALRGRADGYDPAEHRLEEIKTHRGDLSRLRSGQRALHQAQLQVYGALLCRSQQLPAVTLTLVYLDINTGSETVLSEPGDAVALWRILEDLCDKFFCWAQQERQHRVRRDLSLSALRFPFAHFRRGQRDLAETVFKSLMTKSTLMLQAPTGSGKTIGTLFPALMTMPQQKLDRLFWLTSRTTGRQLALAGLRQILDVQTSPPTLRVLELTARHQACEYPNSACNGDSCPLAEGFFDRLPAAREALVREGGIFDRSRLRTAALAHRLCPYYLTQEMARWVDVVIADVNYQFDQQALLYALTVENEWRTALLIDEAHNMVDRGRAMYSATLSQEQVLAVKRQAPEVLKKPLEALARRWRRLVKRLDIGPGQRLTRQLDELPTELVNALPGLIDHLSDYLGEHPAEAALQTLMFELAAFRQLADQFGDHSVCELRVGSAGMAKLEIHNLVPAEFLRRRFAVSRGTVLFSATLSPGDYHRNLLGLPDNSLWREMESPFLPAQLDVRIVPQISTRLSDRGRSLVPAVARVLNQWRRNPGNYLVYASSFAYLEQLHDSLRAAATGLVSRCQTPAMNQEQRQEFIDSFTDDACQVGFAVLGGPFAEGIDLPGKRLAGVFILTLGLPPHDSRHELLKARLQRQFGKGYEYAYLYPGLQKVVQAAGRVIRTTEDTGIIELIDDRFCRKDIQLLLPSWWPKAAVQAPESAHNMQYFIQSMP